MIKIFVSHATTGIQQQDENISTLLHKEILKNHFGVIPVAYSSWNKPIEVSIDGETTIVESNLYFIMEFRPSEVWLYGDRIDARMKNEINLAYALRIPIVPQNKTIRQAFKELELPQHKFMTQRDFWMLIGALVVILTIVLFMLFTCTSNVTA